MKIGYLMQKGEEIRHPPYNGPANHVRHVVGELRTRGHQVRILFRLDNRLWIGDDMETFRPVEVRQIDRGLGRLVERGIRRTQSALSLPYFGWFDSLRFRLACEQELRDCDVFLERMSWMLNGGAWAARRMKIPLVLEYNGDPLVDLEAKGIAPRGLQRRIAIDRMQQTLNNAARVVATGDGWKDDCIRTWGVPKERVKVIENGTVLTRVLERDALGAFQPERGGAAAPLTLVYLGGFYAWHGIQILFEALQSVLARRPEVRLVLIGSGPGEAEARRRVELLGLSGCVEFRGQLSVKAYAPILAHADIGVSPYCNWPEYSGLKIFDYKAAGLACIASGVDGQPRSLKHGETGLIVPPCDPAALAGAILQLADQPDLRRRMGRTARLEAESIHGWEHTAERLESVIMDALRAGNLQPGSSDERAAG